VYPVVDFYTKTWNHRKTVQKTPKNTKNNNLLKTNTILNTEIWAEWGSDFYISLPGVVVRPLAPPSVTITL